MLFDRAKPHLGGDAGRRFAAERHPLFQGELAGAGLAIKTGGLSESIRFFVPASRIDGARELVEELFSKEIE